MEFQTWHWCLIRQLDAWKKNPKTQMVMKPFSHTSNMNSKDLKLCTN